MSAPPAIPTRVRFNQFELDLTSGELHSADRKVTLPPKAFAVLKALLERPGDVVTREELRARLWPADTFVEFNDSLNHAVKKLRQALGDSAGQPECVETLPRYGYRLIATGVRTTEPVPRIRALAVLPLANLSGDPRQEYFADGMTDALIADLSRIRTVKVISRTSVMRYKDTKKALPEIARELKVDGVVEGTVQRFHGQVRVTVQLMNAPADAHLWAGTYERDFREVLALQVEVARAVAAEIQAVLTPEQAVHKDPERPVSSEAYEAYLKGKSHWYRLAPGHLDRAISYFQFALEKDPDFPLAHVGIANVWLLRADVGLMPPGEAFPKARAAVLKALELNETLAEGHVVLANVTALYDWDWPAGERAFRRAVELNPNSADAHFMYADFLISMKRVKEWAAEMKRVLDLDPLNPFFQCFYGWHLVYLRQYDEALAQLREALAATSDFSSVHLGLWGALYKKGGHEGALAEARNFFCALRDHEVADALQRGYAEGGYLRAMHCGAETLVRRAQERYVPGVRIARLYAHAEEPERVLEWLEAAHTHRESALGHLNVAWDWDHVRGDPRFLDLVRRVGLPV